MKRPPRQPYASEKAEDDSAFSHVPTFAIERRLIREGFRTIAGVDEAGRGALAGPLCVGMVVFDASLVLSPDCILAGVNDSKLLSHRRRLAALEEIERHAILATSVLVSHRTVDRLNVNGATEFAIERLLRETPVPPDIILLDGVFRFNTPVPIRPVTKGDRRSLSIAAASIVAKVRRDGILCRLDLLYPSYRFGKNKGYGTPEHLRALRDQGCSPVHRRSYEPLRSMAGVESES